MLNILKYSKFYLIIVGIGMIISLILLIIWGLPLNIEFKGGSQIEVQFDNEPDVEKIKEDIKKLNLGEVVVQKSEGNGVILKTKRIDEIEHKKILETLGNPKEISFENIIPTIGKELKTKTIIATLISVILIGLYIFNTFKKSSFIIPSFHYSFAVVIAGIHDILMVCGIFAILGKFFGTEIGSPFIAAILTILGYSINDTIIVLDRVRENIKIGSHKDIEETLNVSLSQIIVRSIFTSLCVLFPLVAILIWGGESVFTFAFALIWGTIFGTSSSIFIAPSLLLEMNRKK